MNQRMYLWAIAFRLFCSTAALGQPHVDLHNIELTSLGPQINTPYGDADPKISPAGDLLFLCRRNDPQNVGGPNTGADIWYANKKADGSWSEAVNIGAPINNEHFNMVIGIRADGKAMMVQGVYDTPDKFSFEGVSICYRTATGWSAPVSAPIQGYKYKKGSVSYSVSPDFTVLLLGIENKDSHGESDLYVSFIQPDGSWSKPLNLGVQVNTAAAEISPVLASDMKTLYFSSKGWGGMGNYDIFMTRRLDNSWTRWSKPQNLGPLVNTSGYDADFSLDASGKVAYVSRDGQQTGFDIFQVNLPEESQPEPMVLVKGSVKNGRTSDPIPAQLTYYQLETGKALGNIAVSPTGSYEVWLPCSQQYSFAAEADGFIASSSHVDLRKIKSPAEYSINIELMPVAVGSVIRLNNVFFESRKAILQDTSFPELNKVVALLQQFPTMYIEIAGHTDNLGSPVDNMYLSRERAAAVQQYLIGQGIAPERISSVGYGESKPVVDNLSEAQRSLNRRVEFVIKQVE